MILMKNSMLPTKDEPKKENGELFLMGRGIHSFFISLFMTIGRIDNES